MKQLDLFDWIPSSTSETIMTPLSVGAPSGGATIICFPQDRNVGKARHVAALILKREGAERDSYWRQVCNRLAGTMSKAGIDDDEIDRQLSALSRAVSLEMSRLDHSDRQRPGGAV